MLIQKFIFACGFAGCVPLRLLSMLLCMTCVTATAALDLTAGGLDTAGARAAPELAQHGQGREIYNFRCYYCHGYAGDAKTLASTYLTPRPRNFRAPEARSLSREAMIKAVTEGRQGTAMMAFSRTLSAAEIALVVDFVREEFITADRDNTRYHTPENGWPGHDRYRIAFPFATGEIALDAPQSSLAPRQQAGRQLFLNSCISCHDRARVIDEGVIWDAEAVSYPRHGFRTGDFLLPPDSVSGASPFAQHDMPSRVADLSERERAGERLFQDNCAFCHGADGTGKNWIGTFLQPHARDLTSAEVMQDMTRTRLYETIAGGITGTSMPAWRNVLAPGQIEAVIDYIDRVFHQLASTPHREEIHTK